MPAKMVTSCTRGKVLTHFFLLNTALIHDCLAKGRERERERERERRKKERKGKKNTK
jgi:hypothetical protein